MLTLDHLAWTLPNGTKIVHDISLNAENGQLIVVTGPNGGGKTTLAKLIVGLETPDSGRILLDDTDITALDITKRAQLGIAYAFQQPVRFKGLTVRDLLELAAGTTLSESEICNLLGNVGLCANDYINREMNKTLSGGEAKRIEIATVLARNANLCIFDEPEAGIDLWSFARLVDTFETLRAKRDRTLLIISHQERILSIADTIVVVADGRVKRVGPRDEILPSLMENEYATMCPLEKGAAK